MRSNAPPQLEAIGNPVVYTPEPDGPGLVAYCNAVCQDDTNEGDVFLDLRHFDFLDSLSTLAVLKLRTSFSARGRNFYLINTSPHLLAILKNSRLDRIIYTFSPASD